MTTLDNILEYFKVKSHFIIYKHSVASPVSNFSYSHLRMSAFFGNFNTKMKAVEEELSEETVGILQRFQYEENVDFDGLMEGLYNYKNLAKQEFIKMHQPL
jgi:hypothetical protein